MRISPAGGPLSARDVGIDIALIQSSSALELTGWTDGHDCGRQSDSTYDSAALPVSWSVCTDLISARLRQSRPRSVLLLRLALNLQPPLRSSFT